MPLPILTADVNLVLHLYSTHQYQTPSLKHLYYPCLVSTPYLFPITSQSTISPAPVQSVPHLCCPCAVNKLCYPCPVRISTFCPLPVRSPPLLPMSNQNTTSAAHIQSPHYYQSEFHLSCPCPARIPPLLLMPSQYNITSALVLSCHYLSYPCAVSTCTPPSLPISIYYTIMSGHVHSEYHQCSKSEIVSQTKQCDCLRVVQYSVPMYGMQGES